MEGYLSPAYARSLAEFGEPRALPASGGWILRRPVPNGTCADAMGCYPLFACRDWSRLADDVERLAGDVIALSLVADPFSPLEPAALAAAFPDVCRPFKEHFVVDMDRAQELPVHHRRNLRAALRSVVVERCDDLPRYASDWVRLYGQLIARHQIRGMSAFSPTALALQLEVPGSILLRATSGGETLGMTLWYQQGEVAYYHLGAYDSAGYAARASYALVHEAIERFRGRVRWLDLGAGAGVEGDAGDGLTRFKRGWATSTRTAFFCGRVFDRDGYDRLSRERGTLGAAYFPAYRQGEFA